MSEKPPTDAAEEATSELAARAIAMLEECGSELRKVNSDPSYQRWRDRTARKIRDHVGAVEAKTFTKDSGGVFFLGPRSWADTGAVEAALCLGHLSRELRDHPDQVFAREQEARDERAKEEEAARALGGVTADRVVAALYALEEARALKDGAHVGLVLRLGVGVALVVVTIARREAFVVSWEVLEPLLYIAGVIVALTGVVIGGRLQRGTSWLFLRALSKRFDREQLKRILEGQRRG